MKVYIELEGPRQEPLVTEHESEEAFVRAALGTVPVQDERLVIDGFIDIPVYRDQAAFERAMKEYRNDRAGLLGLFNADSDNYHGSFRDSIGDLYVWVDPETVERAEADRAVA